jgi:hypothetical protein
MSNSIWDTMERIMLEKRIAALEADNARKGLAIRSAIGWFEDYARQHEAKTPPDMVKAQRNRIRADYMRQALKEAP